MRRGDVTLVVSAATFREFTGVPQSVRGVLPSIDPEHLERIEITRGSKIWRIGILKVAHLLGRCVPMPCISPQRPWCRWTFWPVGISDTW